MILRPAFPLFVNRSFAGGAEAPGPTLCFAQLFALRKLCAEHRRDHQLGDPLARAQPQMIRRRNSQELRVFLRGSRNRPCRALFSTVMPWRAARPERGRTWPSVPRGSAMRDAGRNLRPAAGRDRHRRIRRHRGHQIEAGGAGALVGRQRQAGAVRQPHDLDLRRISFLSRPAPRRSAGSARRRPRSWIAAANARRRSLVTRWMVLLSPPMMPVSGDTSLARIQSQPLRASFALACSTTCSVSAAKPITSFGRRVLRCATVERMSGFSTSASSGAPLPVFLIFSRLFAAVRQSATAAANTATSAGKRRLDRRQHVARGLRP